MKKIICSKWLIFALLFLIVACKKEEESTKTIDVKGTKWVVHYAGGSSGNYFITYKSNNDFIFDEGSIINPAGTFSQSADSIKWEFETYSVGSYYYDGKLISNDSMTGKIRFSNYVSAGTFTAKKQ